MPYKDIDKAREANRKSYHKHEDARKEYGKEYYEAHKTAKTIRSKENYENNKELRRKQSRELTLFKRYGLTTEGYTEMWNAQSGLCLICDIPLIQGLGTGRNSGNVHVDHDHKTGAVRGLLCSSHNLGMGYFNDDPILLRRAADYLEKSKDRKGKGNG